MNPTTCYELIELLNKSESVEEIHDVCSKICEHAGFDHFLYCARIPTSFIKPYIIVISGYPTDWRTRYNEQGYMHLDPTVAHCATRVTPLPWQAIEPLIKSDAKVQRFFQESKDFGLKSGISLPVHSAHGEASMLSLSSSMDSTTTQKQILESSPFLQFIATHVHETARRLIELREIAPPVPTLTDRERECLLWSADGKTSWEIAQILGVSERTVIFHLQNSSGKLGVNNRQHAVARAISMGLLAPQIG